MNYQEKVYLCSDSSFNSLLLRRPLTRQEECARGSSHPYLQMVDKKMVGGEISRANCISRTYVSTFFRLIRGNGRGKKISLLFAGR